ncbi:MAG TPA: sigma-70 family RNA polymerase sigma factor [archaeon]|nr:sigma-70 family RNA polymerase sigma factor [archaeon]
MVIRDSGHVFQDEYILVEKLKQGDPEAIDDVVDRYQQQLYAFIMRMVSNQAEAEDIFQDTWIRAIRNIGSFRGDARFSTWLFQIALNLCRNLMRQHSRRSFVPLEEAGNLAEESGIDAVKILQVQQIRKLVLSLPTKMREIVILRYYHDYGDQEIADITGLPPGTVKSRLHRANLMLRSKIEANETLISSMEVD